MIHVSKAPLRIGLAGGGTDVSPFSDLYGGAILNATINLYASASIVPRDDNKVIFRAIDRGERLEFDLCPEREVTDLLKLQVGIFNRISKDYGPLPSGFELFTSIDAPSGSGLGTSSTLVVSILGAYVEWLKLPLGEYDIARLAFSIEREDLDMAGGKQDQYAATFGGVNFMEFLKDSNVIINPLRVKTRTLKELEYHLLLFYTQTERESAKIIEAQKANVQSNTESSLEATKKLKEQAFMMKNTLLRGEIADIGKTLAYGWENKKQLAKGITNPAIDNIYETAIAAGASGGKISGAGGGGFMIFYCPKNTGYEVIKALHKIGVEHQRYNFEETGLTTWTSYQ